MFDSPDASAPQVLVAHAGRDYRGYNFNVSALQNAKYAIEQRPTATPGAKYIAAVHRLMMGASEEGADMPGEAGKFRGPGELSFKRGHYGVESGRRDAEFALLHAQTTELELKGEHDPVARAAFLTARVAAISPFSDGNLRVGWAVGASALIASGSATRFTSAPSKEALEIASKEAADTANIRPLMNAMHLSLGQPEKVSDTPYFAPFKITPELARAGETEFSVAQDIERSRNKEATSPAPLKKERHAIALDFFAAISKRTEVPEVTVSSGSKTYGLDGYSAVSLPKEGCGLSSPARDGSTGYTPGSR